MPVEPMFTMPQVLIGIIILFVAVRIAADIIENHIESNEAQAKSRRKHLSPSQRAIERYKREAS